MDDKGLLRWARNGELVDTVDDLWRDSGDGTGIVPSSEDDERPAIIRRTSFDVAPIKEGNSLEISSSPSFDGTSVTRTNSLMAWVKKNVTPTGITRRLIRRTIRKDTWIYVAVSYCTVKVFS